MDGENLTNRYDQFISAGASLTLSRPDKGKADAFAPYRHAFYDHLELAVALHQIKYVYIIEHVNCGAYLYSPPDEPYEGVDLDNCCPVTWDELRECRQQLGKAQQFSRDIVEYSRLRQRAPGVIPEQPFRLPGTSEGLQALVRRIYDDRYVRAPHCRDWDLKVYAFRMDLRGVVKPLQSCPTHQPATEHESDTPPLRAIPFGQPEPAGDWPAPRDEVTTERRAGASGSGPETSRRATRPATPRKASKPRKSGK
jgi:hypothetical protein